MGVNAGIAPDMVMMLKEDSSKTGRSGCLMLLRSDCEKTRSAETDKILNNEISKEFGNNITMNGHQARMNKNILIQKLLEHFKGSTKQGDGTLGQQRVLRQCQRRIQDQLHI